jgi:predicted transposase YbfD/YdcC
VRGDALLAQKELSRQIIKAGGDYLWYIKDNHPTLRQQLAAYFAAAPSTDGAAHAYDKGHGRLQQRTLRTTSQLTQTLDWPYASQAFCLERQVVVGATPQRRAQTVYGLTSLPALEASAARLIEMTRGHWSIENGLHYRRAVTLREDACRMKSRTAAQAWAVVNNLVQGLGWVWLVVPPFAGRAWSVSLSG